MKFQLAQAMEMLRRTPQVLEELLNGLSDEWIHAHEGPDTWSPFDVVGHLIHGEETDWIPRMKIMLSEHGDRKLIPFDRFAMLEKSKGKTLQQLLAEFKSLRHQSLLELEAANLSEEDLSRTALHPEFGEVTLRQHLSTWVAHDLNHLTQIARVMAKQYSDEVGPWKKYLSVLSG